MGTMARSWQGHGIGGAAYVIPVIPDVKIKFLSELKNAQSIVSMQFRTWDNARYLAYFDLARLLLPLMSYSRMALVSRLQRGG